MRNTLMRAASAHLFFAAFALASFSALLVGLHQVLGRLESDLRNNLSAVVFLQPTVQDDSAALLEPILRAADPELSKTVFVSKAAALDQAQADPALAKSLMVLKENPLPASYTVQWRDLAWVSRSQPGDLIRKIPEVQEIRWDPQMQSSFQRIYEWRRWLSRVTGVGIGGLLLWSFVALYQFLSSQRSLKPLFAQMAIGFLASALVVGAYQVGLSDLGAVAASQRPAVAGATLLMGLIAGLLFFKPAGPHEN